MALRIASAAIRPTFCRAFSTPLAKKYDLFGYEVNPDTSSYVAKIKKCEFYDDAGEVIVEMNLKNTPPDLETYNALLERICNTKSKRSEPVQGESKFCAMMDVLEEMDHRNGIKPNVESWNYVLQDLVSEKEFRLGWFAIDAMKEMKIEPKAELVKLNDENAAKAKNDQTDFPSSLRRQPPLTFDTQAWGM
eukprot:NODE_4797_length_739_cov_367.393791_g4635_i0.p1 GENE.NODE_4797_length_739_cov_367.393791_g4635_i0~~NODE_4797_length_739_cov_367.393791_g4635_i0.p1  ORF type:complete len:214 (+),score=52.98 NODE_4797_length_739_cov_367.393791_g4635_i0:70-642(+)